MNFALSIRSLAWPLLAVMWLSLASLWLVACSGDTVDSLDEIRELQAKSRFAATIEPLRALLDENPDDPEANYLLGRALVQTEDPSLAIWSLRKAMEFPDYAVRAGVLLARAQFMGRTPDDSIRAADEVLAIEPENIEALAIRAQSYVEADRWREGLADIERVAELDPENLTILVPRFMALLHLERIDAAGEALETAKQVVAGTKGKVPTNLPGRLCVAAALFAFERGDRELADRQYADCLEAFPTNIVVVESSVGYYDGLGQSERATEVIEHAFAESREPVFRRAMARRAGRRGDYERQGALLREQVDEQPTGEAWFELGDFYAIHERYDEACDAFEKLVELSPEPLMLFAYADTLILAGRLAEARAVSERLEQQQLRDLVLGRIMLVEGDPAGALRQLEEGIRLWPNNPGARFLAGQAAESLGDFDRAMSEYREAERANPRSTEAGLYLARLLADMGSDRSALTAIQRYVKNHPEDPDGFLLASHIAHRLEVRRIWSQALMRLARLPGQGPLAIAEQARLVAESVGIEEGVEALETSLVDFTDPSNALVLRQLVSLLGELGRHDSARGRVATALGAHPEEADFYELAARVELAADGSTEVARAKFERAIELDSGHVGGLIGLAELAEADGDVKDAIAYYDRAAQADEDEVHAARAAALLVAKDGSADEAERRLLAVLQRHPRDVQAATALARLLASQGRDLERALEYARRADYFRSTPEAAELLGWILVLRGQPSEAIEPLRRSLFQRPNSTAAQLYLGRALAGTGDREGARKVFEQVIAASGPEAVEARAELERLDEAG